MKKLHVDGLLESLDYESLDACEPCLMGKMTKTPFFGTMERATDLLEITHTDVCGTMSVEARGGYRYFLTFTDDLSRYGYIYLMKHKCKIFELRVWPSIKTMWNSFTNLCHLEHHIIMVCPNGITILY